jgi:predicted nucleic acid-binding protein
MEKETLVLDASVIVKWFCEEEYTDIALRLRDRFFVGELTIVVPELMFYEV